MTDECNESKTFIAPCCEDHSTIKLPFLLISHIMKKLDFFRKSAKPPGNF